MNKLFGIIIAILGTWLSAAALVGDQRLCVWEEKARNFVASVQTKNKDLWKNHFERYDSISTNGLDLEGGCGPVIFIMMVGVAINLLPLYGDHWFVYAIKIIGLCLFFMPYRSLQVLWLLLFVFIKSIYLIIGVFIGLYVFVINILIAPYAFFDRIVIRAKLRSTMGLIGLVLETIGILLTI